MSQSRSDHLLDTDGVLFEEPGADDVAPFVTEETSGADDEDEAHAEEVKSWKKCPWWRRPSPYWLIFAVPVSSMGFAASFTSRVEIYTQLTCRVHKPEYFTESPSQRLVQPTIVAPPAHGFGIATMQGSSFEDATDSPYVVIPSTNNSSTKPAEQTRQKCASDPEVQAAAARLSATLTTTMGILSCLVTGWWGTLSDRYGRVLVLTLSIMGLFLTELTFIITASFVDYLPGGYWFLLTGPVVEGLLGSMPTGVAVTHAYIADTAEPSSRSRMFALALGPVYVGFALGPLVGGVMIHLTGLPLSPFFLSAALHLLYAMFLIFVLPESLTRARARRACLLYEVEKRETMTLPLALRLSKNVTRFLSALAVLLPHDTKDGNEYRGRMKDWSLFLLALCYGLNALNIAILPFLFQYAVASFHWSGETTSYYYASISVTRALVLIIILPLITKFLKGSGSSSTYTSLATDDVHEEATEHPSSSPLRSQESPTQRTPLLPPPARALVRSSNADLTLARCALAVEVFAYCVMASATSGSLFALATITGALSVAFSPIVQALGVDFHGSGGGSGGMGRLFGALSVVQALGSQILGPAVYGFVYAHTVATFPQTIMVLSAVGFMTAFVLLWFVKIPGQGRSASRDFGGGQVE